MTVSPDWSWQRVALAGIRDALSLPAWIVGFGLIGIGSLAHDVGYPVGVAVLSTIFVWAGPSQVLFFASIAAGAAWSAIAIAIGFASLRFLPMTVAILPLLRRPGQSVWMQLLLAHYVAVTAWTEGLRRLPAIPPHQRVAYFLGFANTCMTVSAIGTFAGYYLLGELPIPFAAGLLCLTPIFFLVSLSAGLRHRGDVAALLLGLALAPLCQLYIGGGFDLIVAGLIAGTIAFLIGRGRKAA
ncbi:AzlC family ABC transporter permease [Bosea sp. (in: a-proteobacteria)]|uniref:AzlC family ABC transporter permease n=1 Tax=Bosea sp. (in: a-proteobacteria) TaxID=1871050 RepID=UPI003B3AA774